MQAIFFWLWPKFMLYAFLSSVPSENWFEHKLLYFLILRYHLEQRAKNTILLNESTDCKTHCSFRTLKVENHAFWSQSYNKCFFFLARNQASFCDPWYTSKFWWFFFFSFFHVWNRHRQFQPVPKWRDWSLHSEKMPALLMVSSESLGLLSAQVQVMLPPGQPFRVGV